jgi:hypothetical protein
MGCNIHLHIEIMINDKWEHFSAPYMPRAYSLYGKMAGVRDETQIPISLPKGIPDDITLITEIDLKQDHYHHPSWFNIEEIKQLEIWMDEKAKKEKDSFKWYPGANFYLCMEQMTGYLFGNGFHKQKENGVQDVRFVFWFDN